MTTTLPSLKSRRAYLSWFTRNGYLMPGPLNIPEEFLTDQERAWIKAHPEYPPHVSFQSTPPDAGEGEGVKGE